MKVYLLMKHYSLQGHQDTDVISINKTFPAVPKNETDGCGCCWRKFFVLEIDETVLALDSSIVEDIYVKQI